MINYISAKEAAEKWRISQRRVSILCAEKRIKGADFVGNMWIIPTEAEKPMDKRTIRYEKKELTTIKPFVKWAGGKGQLVEKIESIIPTAEHNVLTKYAEPFVGGGALLFDMLSKYDFDEIYISDINEELINAYSVIKNNVEVLIEQLERLQAEYHSRNDDDRSTFYYAVRDMFNLISLNANTAVVKASFFIFLNKTCFNGLYRVNRNGQFNVPIGSYKMPTICDAENLRKVSIALQKVTICCCDFSKSQSFIDKNTLVYIDPPYRPLSKTSSFTAYSADCFDDNEQRRLAQFVDDINDLGARVILSNSDPQNENENDDFFEKLYGKYNICKVEAARMINSKGTKRNKIKELLISNY